MNYPLPEVHNLLVTGSKDNEIEVITALFSMKEARLEWIVSYGQSSDEGFWYEQDQDEWVMLLKGNAVLRFEGDCDLSLQAGDCLTLPAGLKHRVHSVSDDAIWLGLHGDLSSPSTGHIAC